jgi:LVIVD repeat-containing protein
VKRTITVIAALVGLLIGALPGANAGPQDGWASDNVEYVRFVPFETGTATGAKIVGKFMYVTSWKSFSIYDVSDPENPVNMSITPFAKDTADEGTGFRFENEDVATNGKILIFSQQLPVAHLFVYDVEDKSNPVLIGHLTQGGAHTAECLLDCKWLYGSNGNIWDLRDPTKPELQKEKWTEGMPATGAHDLNEVAPGLMLSSSRPIVYLDARKDPTHPKLLAVGDDKKVTGGIHSNRWPNQATDDIVLFSSETNFTGRCSGTNGAFMTWDASNWKKSHAFKLLDAFQFENGTYSDGKPAANAMGCSAHWFQEHPSFDNGGLVALGSYDHGTRFMNVASNGKITEVGYFVPNAGETSAAYWVSDELVYSIDYTRGFDILRYTGKV